jgi:GntR family transcriptional regulator
LIQINFSSAIPAYLQIVEQVKRMAASGTIRPGDSLPTIRALAEQVRLNRNTVAKAYSELEREGVIETVSGKGCFLTNAKSPLSAEARRELIARDIDTAIIQAHQLKVSRQQFLEMLHKRWDLLEQQQKNSARLQSRQP